MNEKKYMVTESELISFLEYGRRSENMILYDVRNFLKSKTEVKMLGREEVEDFLKQIITIAVSQFCNEDDEPMEDLPMQIWEDFETDFNRIITDICNLAIDNEYKLIATQQVDEDLWTLELKQGMRPISIYGLEKYEGKNIDVYIKERKE